MNAADVLERNNGPLGKNAPPRDCTKTESLIYWISVDTEYTATYLENSIKSQNIKRNSRDEAAVGGLIVVILSFIVFFIFLLLWGK